MAAMQPESGQPEMGEPEPGQPEPVSSAAGAGGQPGSD
jgi:hypothetical protein